MEKEYQFERKMDARLIFSVLAAGLMSFTGVVVETSMNITFPALMKEFGVGTSTVQWITTGYLLVLTLVIPGSAFLKQRFRMKTLFLSAIISFLIGTVLCLIAPAFWILLLGRLIQGIGTGIALPLMFNIILEQTPYGRIGFMMGIATMITAVAPAVGPSLGGVIVSFLGWRYIFLILLPLLILAFFLGIFSIRQSSPVGHPKLDVSGYMELGGTFICVIFATSLAGKYGWVSGPVLGLFAATAVLLSLYTHHSLHTREPLIDFHMFSYKGFAFGVTGQLALFVGLLGLGFVIPNYAQLSLGASAMISGCILLPGCAAGAVLNPVSGKILDRFGAAKPLLIGAVLVSASSAAFCFPVYGRSGAIIRLLVIYIFFQTGTGCLTSCNMTNGLNCLPDRFRSGGNALYTTFQQLAGGLGTAITSSIVSAAQAAGSSHIAAATAAGANKAFVAVLAAEVLMLICIITEVRNTPKLVKDNKR